MTGSDENEDNAEPIPPFLLPDALPGKSKKSPAKFRPSSSPPKIIKQSLKNFSGLEGVTPGMLSTQDSLEVVQKLGLKPDGSITRRSVQQEMSVPVTTSSASGKNVLFLFVYCFALLSLSLPPFFPPQTTEEENL